MRTPASDDTERHRDDQRDGWRPRDGRDDPADDAAAIRLPPRLLEGWFDAIAERMAGRSIRGSRNMRSAGPRSNPDPRCVTKDEMSTTRRESDASAMSRSGDPDRHRRGLRHIASSSCIRRVRRIALLANGDAGGSRAPGGGRMATVHAPEANATISGSRRRVRASSRAPIHTTLRRADGVRSSTRSTVGGGIRHLAAPYVGDRHSVWRCRSRLARGTVVTFDGVKADPIARARRRPDRVARTLTSGPTTRPSLPRLPVVVRGADPRPDHAGR